MEGNMAIQWRLFLLVAFVFLGLLIKVQAQVDLGTKRDEVGECRCMVVGGSYGMIGEMTSKRCVELCKTHPSYVDTYAFAYNMRLDKFVGRRCPSDMVVKHWNVMWPALNQVVYDLPYCSDGKRGKK